MAKKPKAVEPKTGDPFIAEVSDMLFATKSLDRLGKGQATWGDLANIGVTAASFAVYPAALGLLGAGALVRVIKAASKVSAMDGIPVAVKRTAAKTLDDALIVKREGYPAPRRREEPGTLGGPNKVTGSDGRTWYSPPLRPLPRQVGDNVDEGLDTLKRDDQGRLIKEESSTGFDAQKQSDWVDTYLDKKAELRSLQKELAARQPLKKGKKVDDPENPDKIIPTTEITKRINELETYIENNRQNFGETYNRLYPDSEIKPKNWERMSKAQQDAWIKANKDEISFTAASGLEFQGGRTLTPEEKLMAREPGTVKTADTAVSRLEFLGGKTLTAEEKLRVDDIYPPNEVPIASQRGPMTRLETIAARKRARINQLDEAEIIQDKELEKLGLPPGDKNKKAYDDAQSYEDKDLPEPGGGGRWYIGSSAIKLDEALGFRVPKKISKNTPERSTLADMDELEYDLLYSRINLVNARTPEEKRLYESAYEQARKAIKDRTKLDGIKTPTILKTSTQEQEELGDRLFKLQDIRVSVKTSMYTPKGKPATVNIYDRIRHIQNILEKEKRDYLPNSPQYKAQIVRRYKIDTEEGAAKYAGVIKKYETELAKLEELAPKTWKSLRDIIRSGQLGDVAIRRFMNNVRTNPIDPKNKKDLFNLIDELIDQVKDPVLKARMIKFSNSEKVGKREANKAAMEARLAKEDVAIKARFDRNPPKVRQAQIESNSDITFHSGGAQGADSAWAAAADRAGIKTIAHSFDGHESLPYGAGFVGIRPALETRNILTKAQLMAQSRLVNAAGQIIGDKTAGTNFAPGKLVHRNAYQVKDSDAVLAVVNGWQKIGDGTRFTVGGKGTPWAVEMGILLKKPVFAFEQGAGRWFKFNPETKVWDELDGLPPKFKTIAGIGTSKELKYNGKKAIEEYTQHVSRGTKAKAVESTVSALKPIDSFRGTNQFLSNMSESSFRVGQETYPTVEHFFQAMKTTNPTERAKILAAKTPAEAKRIGGRVQLPANWSKIKLEVMEVGLRAKFQQNPELKKKLIDTGDADLIEGNTWGDTYWGQVDGKGENNLGKLLMKIRKILMEGK